MAENNFLCKKIKLDKTPHGSEKQESTTEIKALPEEMLIFTLKKLNFYDAVNNCSEVCVQWKEIVAKDILKPAIHKLALKKPIFKADIEADGWSDECQDSKLIFSLYQKYQKFEGMFF